MGPFVQKIRSGAARSYAWGMAHKVWSGVIIVIVLGGGYLAYAHYAGNASANQYVLVPVTRGPLVVTVTGSGQVAANQSIDLAPKASGTVTSVNVSTGDTVAAGDLIASVDDTDAQKTLRDAEADLTSAQIAYQESVTNSQTGTTKDEGDAFAAASSAVTDMTTAIQDLKSALFDTSTLPEETDRENVDAYGLLIGGTGEVQADELRTTYQNALTAYESTLAFAGSITPSSSAADIDSLISSAYQSATVVSEAVSGTHDLMTAADEKLVNNGEKTPAAFTTSLSTISSDDSKIAGDVSSTFAAKNTLEGDIATLGNTGSTPLDIQSAQLTLTKAQNAVQDAKDNLADYFVTAPFPGTIAKVDVQTFDQASSGTTVATLVTNDQYADLSLNEVDAAKVKDGQKAELTFDAIDGLTLSGTVAEVDSLGTVTQGVVTYDVKISFDSQDARVKPGMTVNATITTDSANDALIVPSSAVTTIGNQSFIQVVSAGVSSTTASTTGTGTTGMFGHNRFASSTNGFASSTGRYGMGSSTGMFGSSTGTGTFAGRGAPTQTVDASTVTVTRVPVVVGLSNDTQTQIVSGVTEGELVVESTKTGTAASASSATTARTGTAAVGGARTGGGFAGGGRSPFGG